MHPYLKWNNHLQNICLFWITEMPARLHKPVWCGLLSVDCSLEEVSDCCCSSRGISYPESMVLLAGAGWGRHPKGWKQSWDNMKGKPILVLVKWATERGKRKVRQMKLLWLTYDHSGLPPFFLSKAPLKVCHPKESRAKVLSGSFTVTLFTSLTVSNESGISVPLGPLLS